MWTRIFTFCMILMFPLIYFLRTNAQEMMSWWLDKRDRWNANDLCKMYLDLFDFMTIDYMYDYYLLRCMYINYFSWHSGLRAIWIKQWLFERGWWDDSNVNNNIDEIVSLKLKGMNIFKDNMEYWLSLKWRSSVK